MKKSLMYIFVLSFMAVGFFGCSSKSSEELYNEGLSNVKKQNYKEAIDLFNKAAEEEPESEFAPKSYIEIANIYYARNLKEIPTEQSLLKAIEYYSKTYNDYPKSEVAPKAMFMKGFIESNELNRFEDATKTFNQFVSTYPNNEMVPAAKAELENMGLSPDEVLNKKAESEK